MEQLDLFRDSRHLEQCPDDPPIDAFESIYYTGWQIIYAGRLVLEGTNLVPTEETVDTSGFTS